MIRSVRPKSFDMRRHIFSRKKQDRYHKHTEWTGACADWVTRERNFSEKNLGFELFTARPTPLRLRFPSQSAPSHLWTLPSRSIKSDNERSDKHEHLFSFIAGFCFDKQALSSRCEFATWATQGERIANLISFMGAFCRSQGTLIVISSE